MTITQYDYLNVPRYREGLRGKYLCTMCGQYTTLSESVSHQGFNLVCNSCYYKMMSVIGVSSATLLDNIQVVGREKEKAWEVTKYDKDIQM